MNTIPLLYSHPNKEKYHRFRENIWQKLMGHPIIGFQEKKKDPQKIKKSGKHAQLVKTCKPPVVFIPLHGEKLKCSLNNIHGRNIFCTSLCNIVLNTGQSNKTWKINKKEYIFRGKK